MEQTIHEVRSAVLYACESPSASTVSTAPVHSDVASPEWVHDGSNLNLVRGTESLHSLAVDEVFPIGPETVEVLEIMRSTPYFTADVIVHLVAFLVEHDMKLQEYLDEVYFAAGAPMPDNQQNAAS